LRRQLRSTAAAHALPQRHVATDRAIQHPLQDTTGDEFLEFDESVEPRCDCRPRTATAWGRRQLPTRSLAFGDQL